ncbi:hypothetical protein GCM10009836_51290 [Pseudonocardia ailaonensis]|uniref:Pyridoxamine 5'-phosphate oxidase putative domain-containing protein n=1 Tax=Pseudonocardia ailaonensis TaxID=367279 RepID=A0ABN2NEK1_9PSEU
MRFLDRLLGREDLPAGFGGTLGAEEHVVATAAVRNGGHLVVTNRGIWFPGDEHFGWHLVSKATWADGAMTFVVATEEDLGKAVLLHDGPPRRFPLAEPGAVPKAVHERVTGSILHRERATLPDGRDAWLLDRKVPGRDGTVRQIWPL